MDDRETYLLNGLLARHFSLGRIVRFRPVQRGRQGQAYELFTAQEKEYLALVLPAAYEEAELNASAEAVNALDTERFSVVPFVRAKGGGFVAEGPQNSRLMVSLAPEGSAMAAEQYTEHDISQVGLRLAWMHRLFDEQLPKKESALAGDSALETLARAAVGSQFLPDSIMPEATRMQMFELVNKLEPTGWAHGDIGSESLLHDSDHQLRTVVDWVHLHFGSPLEDLMTAFVFLTIGFGKSETHDRGRCLLDAYYSLLPRSSLNWLQVVASWTCFQMGTLVKKRVVSGMLRAVAQDPEGIADAIQSCL